MTLLARARCRSRLSARSGFTLVELLLVLSLIVIVAAMAAPAFHGPLEGFRLLKSADLVRARWAKARSDAMRSGRTMMFRYQTNSGIYEIAPWQSDADYLESSQMFRTTLAPNAAAGQTSPAAMGDPSFVSIQTEELGENVQFMSISAVDDSRGASIQLALQTQTAQGDWSPPILFYPDGTSSTVRVILCNTRNQYVIVQLRGISGIAEVSELLSSTELPQ